MPHIQKQTSRFKIGTVELYHEFMHGPLSQIAQGQYIVIDNFTNFMPSLDEEDEEDDEDEDNYTMVRLCVNIQRHKYWELFNQICKYPHPLIRNYNHIIRNPRYIQPHIIECFYLPGKEYVAVIKTHWIRLIQRTWKRVFREKKEAIQKRKQIGSLKYLEIYGRWPADCYFMPGLYGLLCFVK